MLNRWQKTVVDRQGNVMPWAALMIRKEADQMPATVYRDREGTDPYPAGQVTADGNGFAFFYAPAGLYRITGQAPAIDWRDVGIGAPFDPDALGTAAAADLIESRYDATPGRVVTAGGFGAGVPGDGALEALDVDLDTVLVSGDYYCAGTCENLPSELPGFLSVSAGGDAERKLQRFVEDVDGGKEYRRITDGTPGVEWRESGGSAGDAPADGLTYARKDGAWIALSDASPARPTLVKPLDTGPCLIKKTAGTISVAAGTYIRVGSAYRHFDVETAVTMPSTLVPGSDYSIWCSPDGTLTAVRDQYGSPASPPATGAVKFGGFHYGLVPAGETVAGGSFSTGPVTGAGGSMAWTQGDVDRIAGINEFSIWDLGWRCVGEQNGMTYSPLTKSWIAIYFCGVTPHLDGISAYNTAVASGTVLPAVPLEWGGDGTLKYTALRSWEAQELVSAHGLRLVRSIEEFIPAAFGVTEGQSLGGGSVTIPATARQPGYTSRIGMEQATGHAWVIGAPVNAIGGSAYSGNGRGSWYGAYGMPLFGGTRDNAANSGSRCAHFSSALSNSNWNYSVRAAGDDQSQSGRAATAPRPDQSF